MDRQRPRRAGFTLIEVLVAMLIVATLIAILLPAVNAAFRRAKEAQIAAEMNNLATALASFRNTYGDYPPSRIMLCESGYASLPATYLSATVGSSTTSPPDLPLADSLSTDMTNQQLMDRSLLYLRKFWPRADFVSAGGTLPGTFNDFDGNGSKHSGAIVLSGSECLAFFLGGIPIQASATGPPLGLSGFSKSPRYPFVNSATASNRTVPNYEFNNGRLIDQDGDLIPSYIDPINTTPGTRCSYAYFSAYGGNSYDPNDDNGNGRNNPVSTYEFEDDLSTIVERGFSVSFPVFNASGTQASLAISPGPNPYTSGPPALGNVSWINPSSFQLICCGQDGFWGLGGTYNPNAGDVGRLPILPIGADPGNVHSDDTTNVRLRESDNISNFGGRLD